MNIKNILVKGTLISALLLPAAFSCALDYVIGVTDPQNDEERRDKLSTAKFYSHTEYRSDPIPGKPGPNDKLRFHWGTYYFEVDVDVNVGIFEIADSCEVHAKNRNIRIKKDFNYAISNRDAYRTLFVFDSGTIQCGGNLRFTFWDKSKTAGTGVFQLINSKADFEGGISCVIPVNTFVVKPSERAGVIMDLKGNTRLNFGGGAVIDDIIREAPDDWGFKFRFSEDGGAMPQVYFQKRTNFEGCDIEVNFPPDMKVGKYTLIDFNDKRSSVEKARSVVVNGKKVSYGENISLKGGKTAVLEIAPSIYGRDKRTANDLVLTIK